MTSFSRRKRDNNIRKLENIRQVKLYQIKQSFNAIKIYIGIVLSIVCLKSKRFRDPSNQGTGSIRFRGTGAHPYLLHETNDEVLKSYATITL